MSGTILQFESDNLIVERDISAELAELEFISEFYGWDNGRLVCIQYDTQKGNTDDIEDDLEALCELGVTGWLEMSAPDGGGRWKYALTETGVKEIEQVVVDTTVLVDLEHCKSQLQRLAATLIQLGMYDEVKDIFEEVTA